MKDIQACFYDLSEGESIFIIHETSFCPSLTSNSYIVFYDQLLTSVVDSR